MQGGMSEAGLLERIRNDEPGAFEQFVESFAERIFGFGVRMCGEREDARDVLQDTLLQAFTSLRQLRHPEALRSWVFRVAANACLMKRRRGKFDTLWISGAAGLLVLVIGVWALVTATTAIPTFVIPTPASVWRSLITGFSLPLDHPAGWWLHIGVTLREALGGLAAGSVLGLALGPRSSGAIVCSARAAESSDVVEPGGTVAS